METLSGLDEMELDIMKDLKTEPNIIFIYPDGSELKTYFDEETEIEIIKSFLSDKNHSPKEIRFSIIKREPSTVSFSDKTQSQQNQRSSVSDFSKSYRELKTDDKNLNTDMFYKTFKPRKPISRPTSIIKQNHPQITKPIVGEKKASVVQVKEPNKNTITSIVQSEMYLDEESSEHNSESKYEVHLPETDNSQSNGSPHAKSDTRGERKPNPRCMTPNKERVQQTGTDQIPLEKKRSQSSLGKPIPINTVEAKVDSDESKPTDSPPSNTLLSPVKEPEGKPQSRPRPTSSKSYTKPPSKILPEYLFDLSSEDIKISKELKKTDFKIEDIKGDRQPKKKIVDQKDNTDWSKILTLGDLIKKGGYKYDKNAIQILYTYDPKPTNPTSPVKSTTETVFNEQIEFIPNVYNQEGLKTFESEFVPYDMLREKSISQIRKQLGLKYKSGTCTQNFTEKLKETERKSSKSARSFVPKTTNDIEDDQDKPFFVALFSDKLKMIHNEDSLPGNKIYVYFIKSEFINTYRNSLSYLARSAQLYEKPPVVSNEIKIVDLNDKEKEVTTIEVKDLNLKSFTVDELFQTVAKRVEHEIDDISLFAEREGNIVFLFNKSEIVQSIMNSTGSAKFLFMEVTNKKGLMPRMLRNFKNLAKGSITEDEINNIYIHSGRNSDISISTIQFYM